MIGNIKKTIICGYVKTYGPKKGEMCTERVGCRRYFCPAHEFERVYGLRCYLNLGLHWYKVGEGWMYHKGCECVLPSGEECRVLVKMGTNRCWEHRIFGVILYVCKKHTK